MNFAYVNEIVSQLLSNTFSVFCGAGASADITASGKIFSARQPGNFITVN